MKQLLIVIAFIIHLLFSATAAHAQTGLKMNELFEGRIIPQERMVETRVRGKTLEKYQLTYYRSLRFTATKEETLQLRRMVDDDSRGRFTSVYETKGAYTQKVQVPSQGDKNRFLCYQEQWKKIDYQREVTVIYMEGHVADLGELEELLK